MVYGLHAVVVKKPINYNEAREHAQNFIKDKNKKFFRETLASFRFRNIPKQKFINKSFRTKKINDKISLIYGELKPEFSNLQGAGLFDFFRKGFSKVAEKVKETFAPSKNYNNKSKETLEKYGNLPIQSLTIYRTPISGILNTIINFISFGKWDQLKRKYGFDKLFHLALVANVGEKNIIIEKNEVVNIITEYTTNKDTQTLNIPLGGQVITLSELLEKTRQRVGDDKFFLYDAFNNNCQFFISYILDTFGLYTAREKEFLFQDLKEIYENLPSFVPKIMKATTTTGAIINKLTGQGRCILLEYLQNLNKLLKL
jgi:hypothetical protein